MPKGFVTMFGLRARIGSPLYRWLMEVKRRLRVLKGQQTLYSISTMYDSIDVRAIPRTAKAAAGYVDGHWPTFYQLRKWLPRAQLLSIAVFAKDGADALDIEQGNATPEQAPGWVKNQIKAGKKKPCVYASVSEMVRVLKILEASGIPRESVRVITAHYTGKPHLCTAKCWPGFPAKADATQWRDSKLDPLHRNLDTTLLRRGFFKP